MTTLRQIVDKISEETGYEPDTVQEVLESFFAAVGDSLRRYHRVKLRGFGSFVFTLRQPSKRKNPKTQEWVDVPGGPVLRFIPGSRLQATQRKVREIMEKYGAELDDEKVKLAGVGKSNMCPLCGADCGESKICPVHGQEGFEKTIKTGRASTSSAKTNTSREG